MKKVKKVVRKRINYQLIVDAVRVLNEAAKQHHKSISSMENVLVRHENEISKVQIAQEKSVEVLVAFINEQIGRKKKR